MQAILKKKKKRGDLQLSLLPASPASDRPKPWVCGRGCVGCVGGAVVVGCLLGLNIFWAFAT